MFPLRIYPRERMPLGSRSLRVGCRGRDVRTLQNELAAAGYTLDADGRYGFVTEEAVRKLQARGTLRQDGIAGPATMAALRIVRSGAGLAVHRVRPGDTRGSIAAALGVSVEALERQNLLRRTDKLKPGLLLSVRSRFLLLGPGEPPHAAVKCSAVLGPLLSLTPSGIDCPDDTPPGGLPVIQAEPEIWRWHLRQRKPIILDAIRRLAPERGWRHWVVDLPPQVWWQRRSVLGTLAALTRGTGMAFFPLVRWPSAADRLPDLARLATIGDYLLLDPGEPAFNYRLLGRFLRQVTRTVPADRLIPMIRAGGLLRPAKGVGRTLSVRQARVTAVSARLRLSWDEAERVSRGHHRDGKDSWGLSLLDERGLRARVRLIDRLDCAGLCLSGLTRLALPQTGAWPGEFSVLDSFPPLRHID